MQQFFNSKPCKSAWPSAIYLTDAAGKRLYLRTDWLSRHQVADALSRLRPSATSVEQGRQT
jgi:hypothetical protein